MPILKATILPVVSAVFEENCYLAHMEGRQDCLVIDPGLEPDNILQQLKLQQLTPTAILNTHGHADHIAGNAALKEAYPACPLIIGHGDADKLTDPVKNLSAGFGVGLTSPPADRTVREGDVLEMAGFQLTVLETPGHSEGHVVFVTRGLQPVRIFGGDVLFAGSVGRTDFPDGSWEQLRTSIQEKLFGLPDDSVIYTGHGPTTTLGQEKRSNPYVGLSAG
jgi:glyoxylase-like metal-dependent hydrolase (beta-lactamase superfamily II)